MQILTKHWPDSHLKHLSPLVQSALTSCVTSVFRSPVPPALQRRPGLVTPVLPVHLLRYRVVAAELATFVLRSSGSREERPWRHRVRWNLRGPFYPRWAATWTGGSRCRTRLRPPPIPSLESFRGKVICAWSMRQSSTGSVEPSRRSFVPNAPSWALARATLSPLWLTEWPQ